MKGVGTSDSFLQLRNELRKTRQVESVEMDGARGSKFFKRGDLSAIQQEQYWSKYYDKHTDKRPKPEQKEINSDTAVAIVSKAEEEHEAELHRAEVITRLRARGQAIVLFGETETESRQRLRRLEIEQPDMKEGWKNDFQAALKQVDDELLNEVIQGTQYDAGKHDVQVAKEHDSWEGIEAQASLLGEDDNPIRDCDIILQFLEYLLQRWGRALNARPEIEKRSAKGKNDAGMHKQTVEQIKPLIGALRKHSVNVDIRGHLVRICRLVVLERDYIKATNAYMEMAIGNAPWPVGVTRSGIHQRPGSAKSYVANIAHVLNDETQRKFIQAFKRLMTQCQLYFPADPSKCVDYVKPIPGPAELPPNSS